MNFLANIMFAVILTTIIAIMNFAVIAKNNINYTRKHLIERPETQWLHSNISNDSILVWVTDSTKVFY